MMCISVGSRYEPNGNHSIRLHRVVEYLECFPKERRIQYWCDLFFTNISHEPKNLRFLHRGYVEAYNTTNEWLDTNNRLTDRITKLYADRETIIVEDNKVTIKPLNPCGEWDTTQTFQLALPKSEPDLKPREVVDGGLDEHAPYSLYEIGTFEANTSHLLRIHLPIENKETYMKVVDEDTHEAHVYGEHVLLQQVKFVDFSTSKANNLRAYKEDFDEYLKHYKTTPEIYEVIIVTAEGQKLPKAEPFTPDVSRQVITDDTLRQNTHWFVSYSSDFVVKEQLDNGLSIGVECR